MVTKQVVHAVVTVGLGFEFAECVRPVGYGKMELNRFRRSDVPRVVFNGSIITGR